MCVPIIFLDTVTAFALGGCVKSRKCYDPKGAVLYVVRSRIGLQQLADAGLCNECASCLDS